MSRKVLSFIAFVLILLVLIAPNAVFAQDGTEPPPTIEFEPTAEPTVEPVIAPIEVIDSGTGTDITVNIPPAAEPASSPPSTVNYITLVGVIGLALAFAIKTFQDRGGNFNAETITATVETVSNSEQFNNVLQTVASAIPKEVHDRALNQLDNANETIKQFTAVVAAITTAIDRITDKPADALTAGQLTESMREATRRAGGNA